MPTLIIVPVLLSSSLYGAAFLGMLEYFPRESELGRSALCKELLDTFISLLICFRRVRYLQRNQNVKLRFLYSFELGIDTSGRRINLGWLSVPFSSVGN